MSDNHAPPAGNTNAPSDSDGPSVLLLSGGLDSAALAYSLRPTHTLFVNYGHRTADAEARAARAVATEIGLEHDRVDADLSAVGGGLLHGEEVPEHWPSPEWWPYRNQFLITVAAAWIMRRLDNQVLSNSQITIFTGTVAGDGDRHLDGTADFYDAMSTLMQTQEGRVRVSAPALHLTSQELIIRSGAPDRVLGWTHSCHTSSFPCANCPGCHKRTAVLADVDRLQ